MEPIELTLIGKVPSKKNRYTPNKDGKGFHKDNRLQTELDRLAMQVPGECRDLRLISPSIDFYQTYTKANSDRDNCAQCILDILVGMGTLVDDNIAQCNGRITIHPAVRGEQDSVRVVLTPS